MPRKNDHEEGLQIQREMKKWLSDHGARLWKNGKSELDQVQRLVGLYFVTRFPDAAIIAYHLLNSKK